MSRGNLVSRPHAGASRVLNRGRTILISSRLQPGENGCRPLGSRCTGSHPLERGAAAIRKIKLIPATGLLLVLMLAGCATDRETIVFSDEIPRQSIRNDSLPAPPPKKSLEKPDRIQIEAEIFGWLLQRHFGDDGGYSAVFLQTGEAETEALMKRFPGHVPPIKPLLRVEMRPGRSPLDRDADRPAMILSVDTLDPEDGTVEAVGRWFAGDAVTGFYTFDLKKIGGEWRIESVK